MSFAVWNEKPPFVFAKDDPEQIYKVGEKWVVTDNPARAIQSEIDAVLNRPPLKKISDGDLAQLLVEHGVISQAAVDAAKS